MDRFEADSRIGIDSVSSLLKGNGHMGNLEGQTKTERDGHKEKRVKEKRTR